MRVKNLLIVATVALMLLVGWSVYAQKPNQGKTIWEYKAASFTAPTNHDEKQLNALGAQGWELVGVTEESGVTTYFFKRAQ